MLNNAIKFALFGRRTRSFPRRLWWALSSLLRKTLIFLSAERVRQAVARHRNLVNGVPLAGTISIDVSEYQPGEELSASKARADDALYRSKHAGETGGGISG